MDGSASDCARADCMAHRAGTATELLDQYVSTAGWDVSTRVSNLRYILRAIKPVLGST